MPKPGEDEEVMPHENEVIRAYRQLETQAARMAVLADQQDWEALIGAQEEFTGAVEVLADLEKNATLDEGENKAKYGLLEHILGHDLKVRTCLMERREELARMMAVSRRENALGRAYGTRGKRGLARVGEPPEETRNS